MTVIFVFLLFFSTPTSALSPNSFKPSNLTSICTSTPYPNACFHALKLSLNINISPNILSIIQQSLKSAISGAINLSHILSTANLIQKQKGTLQDCRDLHQITISSLQKTTSMINRNKLSDARAFLSASLTNKVTCLEGLASASGPIKPSLQNSITTTYAHVSNSLSLLPKPAPHRNRRLLGFPPWLSKKDRRLLLSSEVRYDPAQVITVATDGTGNFTTVSDAVNFAPNNSVERVFIYIRQGVYEENVEIPSWKPNIVFLGDGSDATVITGSRSVADGWTTFRSATLAVSGEGFLARDIAIDNTAGPEKHQAVALRINADLAAVYKCVIAGFQDTLYAHSFRQFYRECDIYGTIDYIFGNAAVVFQGCSIISRLPMKGQFTAITAQGRDSPDEDTGISIQNCSILATEDLYSNSSSVKNYLGRPWKVYSRTVYLKSFMDDFIAPEGWTNWVGGEGLDTLYYGEYENYGPGSGTDSRVTWPGYRVMGYEEAYQFTVDNFIAGQEWLDSTSFPYDQRL